MPFGLDGCKLSGSMGDTSLVDDVGGAILEMVTKETIKKMESNFTSSFHVL